MKICILKSLKIEVFFLRKILHFEFLKSVGSLFSKIIILFFFCNF